MADELAVSGDRDRPQAGRVGYLLRQATHALVERSPKDGATDARLRRLLDAVLAISEDLSLSAMLDRLVGEACRLVDAEQAAVAVRATDGSGTADFVVLGLSVAEAHALAASPDDSTLSVPLRTRNQVFGNLYVAGKRGGGEFSEDDALLAIALASAAGVAIQNAQLFESQARRGGWLAASSEIRSAALRGTGEHALASIVVSEARQAARAVFAALLLPETDGSMVVVASTEASLTGAELAPGTSHAGEVSVDRVARILDDIDDGHPAGLSDEVRERTGRCVIAPLGIDDDDTGLGALVVAYPRDAGVVVDLDLDYVVGFAGQVGVAMQLAAGHHDRERIAVLEDRERIARDLHDLVIQRLFAAGMTLQSADPLIADETAKARLSAVADDLDGTIRELRQAIYQLQTPVIADDFRQEIQQVVDRAASGTDVKIRVRHAGAVGSLVPDRIRPHVIAVVAEALSNALRHAGAATVDVSVGIEDGFVSVTVDDDGRGIDPTTSRRSGLANLESRATQLDGTFTIGTGARGVGTRVSWSVPT